MSDNKLKKQRKTGSKAREIMLEQQLAQPSGDKLEAARADIGSRSSNKSAQSHYAFNKPSIPPVSI